jgi:hypothetical protein
MVDGDAYLIFRELRSFKIMPDIAVDRLDVRYSGFSAASAQNTPIGQLPSFSGIKQRASIRTALARRSGTRA